MNSTSSSCSTASRQDQTIPSKYRWGAQDIPEPAPNEYLPDGGVLSDAKVLLHGAVTRLLEDLGRDFSIPPQERPETYDLNSEVGRIDHEIGRLRSVMLAIKNELGQRVATLCKHRNKLAPINQLPPELAANILTHTIPEPSDLSDEETDDIRDTDIGQLKILATVSTGWWHLIQSCPSIWTTIADKERDNIALKLRKSGNLPLIIIYSNDTHKGQPTFLDLTIPHSARWRFASLELENENLDRVRDVIRAPMVSLERLQVLLYDCSSEEIEPLEVAGGEKLRHIDIQGMMLDVNSPALKTVQHLTLGRIHHVTAFQLLEMVAETVDLRSLIIRSFGNPITVEADTRPTNLQLPLQLTSLQKLEIQQMTSVCGAAFLGGINTERLSSLYVDGGSGAEESETLPFHELIRPSRGTSMLSRMIANSAVDFITMRIDDDSTLNISGKRLLAEGVEDTISVQLSHVGWSLYLESMEDFPEFARSLPMVALFLNMYDLQEIPISLNFLIAMPCITSIYAHVDGDTVRRLFQDILGRSHLTERGDIWACPKLEEVRIGGEIGSEEWDEVLLPLINVALGEREQVMSVEGLQRISVVRVGSGPDSPSDWIVEE